MSAARATVLVLLALMAPAAASAVRGSGEADVTPVPRRHEVEIRGLRFLPETVTAAPADTIVWTNHDLLPHTATSAEGGWDSGELGSGASWRLVVPAGGSADYLCAFHPNMKGAVVVR